jgi:hypothetical protein
MEFISVHEVECANYILLYREGTGVGCEIAVENAAKIFYCCWWLRVV